MSKAIATQTAQAAVLSATSNVLAQAIAAYNENKPLALTLRPIVIFVIFSVLSTPPNCLWQSFLEDTFPGKRKPADQGKKKDGGDSEAPLNVANTLKKFALDQTFGAAINTWLFIAYMKGIAGASPDQIWTALRNESWPLYLAGVKVWPVVSLLSFTVIPVEKRIVFGSAVGVLWGIYLSLLAARS